MSERMWFFARNNQQEGPIPESQLKVLLADLTIPSDTLVWSDHLSNWTPASQLDSFVIQGNVSPDIRGEQPHQPEANKEATQPQGSWGLASNESPAATSDYSWGITQNESANAASGYSAGSYQQAESAMSSPDESTQKSGWDNIPVQPGSQAQYAGAADGYQSGIGYAPPRPESHGPTVAHIPAPQGGYGPSTSQINPADATGYSAASRDAYGSSAAQGYTPAASYGQDSSFAGTPQASYGVDNSGNDSGYAAKVGLGQALASGELKTRDPNESSSTIKTSRSLRKSFSTTTVKPSEKEAVLDVNQPDWQAPLVAQTSALVGLGDEPGEPHPWYRFWARSFDHSFAMLFAAIVSIPFSAPVYFTNNPLWAIMAVPLGILGYLGYEPLCLSKWGTTLGKLLWGIQVKKSDGSNLTFGESAKRTWLVFLRSGYVWSVLPIVSSCGGSIATLVIYVIQMNKLNETRITSWDRDLSVAYLHQHLGPGRIALISTIFVVGTALWIGIMAAIVFFAVAAAKLAPSIN